MAIERQGVEQGVSQQHRIEKRARAAIPPAGFIPSPDMYVCCDAAVRAWPGYRKLLEETGKPTEQCDAIEQHAIGVFREIRDLIEAAIASNLPDDTPLVLPPEMGERMILAGAYMRQHIDPESLARYRQMVTHLDAPHQGAFHLAVWEAKWDALGVQSPADLTRKETLRHWWAHEKDGLYNMSGRLDPVAMAGELDPLLPALAPMTPLSEVQLAFLSSRLFEEGRRAGLKKTHAHFLARVALDGAKKKDNPAAWRAIRDRKRGPLLEKVEEILNSL
jgi:hypothetical protein